MSYRILLSKAKARCKGVANLCENDSRLVEKINMACEALLMGDTRTGSAKWPGVVGKYRICTNESCLTWPREIETIEAWALDNCPHDIRNGWYEFLQMGPGLLNDCGGWGCGWQLIDDGQGVAFDDVRGADKKLAVYCDVDETAGASMILRFYSDETKEKVRTEYPSGTWIEGERLVLPAAGNYQLTTNECMAGGLYQVIKPRTKGVVRLYEYDGSTYRALAVYEPNEEIPIYRQSRVPGLSRLTSGTACQKHSVTVVAKFRFIEAHDDNDFLQIPNLDAIRLGVQAVFLEETFKFEEAVKAWALAFGRLHAQLSSFRGSGTSIPIKMVNSSTFGGGIRALR